MSDTASSPWSHILRLAELSRRKSHDVQLAPEAKVRAALADDLGLPGLKKLRFDATLVPEGRADWRLEGRIGASAVQTCVVTLEPVTSRIDEAVERRYSETAELPETAGEIEMPEDDTLEPLPATLDLGAVMAEALALALPAFPRAPGASLGEAVFADPGTAPMRDADALPFAGLREALRGVDQGENDDENEDGGETGPKG